MVNPGQCRTNANSCIEMANDAVDPDMRERLFGLALAWLALTLVCWWAFSTSLPLRARPNARADLKFVDGRVKKAVSLSGASTRPSKAAAVAFM